MFRKKYPFNILVNTDVPNEKSDQTLTMNTDAN